VIRFNYRRPTDDLEIEVMQTKNIKLEGFETLTVRLAHGFASTMLLLLLLSLLVVAAFAQSISAQDAQPRTFASPGEAANALFGAAQKEDEQALEAILGAGKEVTSTSDDVEDNLEREQFSRKYQEMHRLVRESDGTTILYIGAENWPFPVPLVSRDGAWHFDPEAGKQEILFRRIGENEATAIQVCEEFAMAKNAADAKADSEDPITRFAQSLASSGTAITGNTNSNPFRGYYFQIVADSAPQMSGRRGTEGGLTLIAYPAEYQSSGVKTFVVTRKGIVFEKNLGPDTKTIAPQMKARTGSSWHPAV
jgi:Protein of unknown function (DUF2950)